MNEDAVIQVENVSKDFRLPHDKANSLKSAFLQSIRGNREKFEVQHALKDISFEVKKGEFFGIVGRNGSGKSTLLKILAQIYKPTSGKISHKGKLVPFIELGVGFNPELSGKDNVYLSAALLGFSRKQIAAMYEDIVSFAELEKFMDQKLKNYSSGMQVRLAFSIATRSKADILLIDEVLAVGDSSFQRKCYDYFETLKLQKKTVVFVTHDMGAVERFCDKAMLINNSEVVAIGETSKVTEKYSKVNLVHEADKLSNKKSSVEPTSNGCKVDSEIIFNKQKTRAIDSLLPGKIELEFTVNCSQDVNEAQFGVIVKNSLDLPIFATNTKTHKIKLELQKNKPKKIHIIIDNIFSNGEYTVTAGLRSSDDTVIYYTNEHQDKFVVGGRKHEFAITTPGYKLSVD